MNENKIRKILTIITLIIIGVIIMLYQGPGIVAVIIPLGIAWVVCTIIIIWIWRV